MSVPPRMSASDIATAIQEAEHHGMLMAELLAAAQQGVIGLACLVPGMAAPLDLMTGSGKPCVVFVADDCGGGGNPGPVGWPELDTLARWSRQTILNTMRDQVGSYVPAIDVVLEHKRLVLVETSSARAVAWQRALSAGTAPIIALVPPGIALAVPNRTRSSKTRGRLN